MVKKLTPADNAAIGDAIRAVQQRTTAKIGIVVLPASGHYRSLLMLYGFILGSVVSYTLWMFYKLPFPLLLLAQLGGMILVEFVPQLCGLSACLAPKRLRHYKANQAAHFHYLKLHAEMPKDEPFVLLFVSLAERYVHIVTNPIVHRSIPGNWQLVTERFTGSIRTKGPRVACLEAIEHIGEILSGPFPKQ